MKLERIIEILEKHQEWRRDKNVPPKTEMQSPIEIGTAIDYAIHELKKLRISDVIEPKEQLCENPNCENGIVDRDYYGNPIYCQVCDSHN
jgi:hypothetical protein